MKKICFIALLMLLLMPFAFAEDAELPADMPQRNEQGFLDEGEYVYQNESGEGVWVYLSSDTSVIIHSYADAEHPHGWLECDIRCTPESAVTSYMNDAGYHRYDQRSSVRIAKDNHLVLAFSDDFFVSRLNQGNFPLPGVIIRNGEIIATETYENGDTVFPCLEVLALFNDGTLRGFESKAHTAQEYLDMGAANTFAFGPVLIRDGKKAPRMLNEYYHYYLQPRLAMGMIEPYHYMVLAACGEADAYEGVYLQWVTERMLELGVTDAVNLDGGNTVSVVFMGEELTYSGFDRHLYGVIGVGISDRVQ